MKDHKDLIQKLAACAAACQYCADQCLNEDDVAHMVECIRTDRDCADACLQAINFVSRESKYAKDAVEFCRELCKACGDECAHHQMDHCQACAKACRACEEACESFVAVAA